MSGRKRIAVVVGTRPEGIKMAPVLAELRRRPDRFDALLVSTGQHREMLRQALSVFELRPDVDLDLMRPAQDLADITAACITGTRDVLRRERFDHVLVQGDTTTALAVALACFYERVPVSHVEAGLRSGRRDLPFPEEVNRRLVDQVSELLFAPTARARESLLAEGYGDDRIVVTGNTVVDALLVAVEVARRRPPEIAGLPAGALDGKRMILVTGHRRESFGATFEGICSALARIARAHPDVSVVYPVHLNPAVDGPVRRILGGEPRVHLLPPVDYLQLVSLLDRSFAVLTDSGGIQEEAPTLGKPVLVMRDVTERPEGIEAGVARLVGTAEEGIVTAVSELLGDPALRARMSRGGNPYGDGHAAVRIADRLA